MDELMYHEFEQEEASSGSKLLEVFRILFTWIMMAISVVMVVFTVISVNTFDRNDRSILGYKAFIVRSDSMSATDFDAGDLVLVKAVDPSVLQEGDIIAFRSSDTNSFGETFTHKIRMRIVDENGRPAFITYGTTTGVDDLTPVTYDRIQGKYQFALPKIGTFFFFLKTVPGYICCLLLPILAVFLVQGFQGIRLFGRYKKEQIEEIDELRRQELEEIELERKRELQEVARERSRLSRELAETRMLLMEIYRMQSVNGMYYDDRAIVQDDRAAYEDEAYQGSEMIFQNEEAVHSEESGFQNSEAYYDDPLFTKDEFDLDETTSKHVSFDVYDLDDEQDYNDFFDIEIIES